MKYILVTGSEGGMGKSAVNKLVENGYYVIGTDISNQSYNLSNYTFIKADLTKEEDLLNIKENIFKITSHLDGIICLSGIFMIQTLLEGSEKDFRKIFEINFFSIYKLNKVLFDLLNKDSRIIIMTSEV